MPEPISHALTMSSPPDDVDTVHSMLASVWEESEAVSLRDRFSFETALVELASNVMRHANPGSGVSCHLAITVFPDRIEATLTDSGKPGDVELAGRTMPDALAESGRGIPMIKALVDELDYDSGDDGNSWRISRRLQPADDEGSS
jgi:serine/threonine-protein kinase RsbW